MTIEVSTEFKSNRLIYTNLTRETAKRNQQVFDAFNKANTDGDDRISQKEYEEYLKNSCSVDIKTVDVVCTRAANPQVYSRTLLESTQVDFYPGLELGNIANGARELFGMVDLNKDNKLSKNELTAFNRARQLLKQAEQQIKKLCDKHGVKSGTAGLAGLAATLGGACVGLGEGAAVGGVIIGSGPVGWCIAGVAAIGTAGYLYYSSQSYKKECKEIEQNLLKQTNNHPYVLEHIKDFSFYYE